MKLAIGCDDTGFDLKQAVQSYLAETRDDVELIDIGMTDAETVLDYHVIAADAARRLQRGEVDRALLFCGTGMGVAIVANKFKGVYASVVETEFTAKFSRLINASNVLAIGGWVITPYRAQRIAADWLDTAFAAGHAEVEEYADFLKDALKDIRELEDENFAKPVPPVKIAS